MNQRNYPFFSMVTLSLTLMSLIVVAQFFTNKSTQALKQGNEKAVSTFRINRGIQELVNLSFDLQSKLKMITQETPEKRIRSLEDSITMLGYNASVLTTATSKANPTLSAQINNLVDSQVNISESILVSSRQNNKDLLINKIRNLLDNSPADKIYSNCLNLQQTLKDNLQQTLDKNTEQANKLSTYNRILAIFSIFTILFFATIIIRRQSQQLRLIQELKLAEAAAQKSKNSKDEFLANMSHELRTPLNALLGFGNLLNETKLDTQQQEYLEMIQAGGKNLLNIVNDVLDLSKIEAGKLSIVKRQFNLYKLLKQIEKLFSREIKEKKLSYQYLIDKDVPQFVIGDPERLQQIFVNLISNAIKFTHTGGIKIGATVMWIDEPSQKYKLVFSVKDTGEGIPKDKVEHIFERFEQLEQGNRRQYGGTGLGLTIVRNLVEILEGSISVFSQEGEGSEFTFTCILEKSKYEKELITDDRFPKIKFEENKILVVEDNKANQKLLNHLFKKYILSAQMVDNGKDAVSLLTQESFDLIFMDIQMPVMDGFTAIEIIRNQIVDAPPVIAMTAYVTENEIKKCQAAGFTDYISKPIDEKLLIQKAAKYLSVINITTDPSTHLDYLKSLVGNNEIALKEVLTEMEMQWQKDKQELLVYAQDRDLENIKRVLHRLKSTFSPLGRNHIIYDTILNESQYLAPENNPIDHYSDFVKKLDAIVDTIVMY